MKKKLMKKKRLKFSFAKYFSETKNPAYGGIFCLNGFYFGEFSFPSLDY